MLDIRHLQMFYRIRWNDIHLNWKRLTSICWILDMNFPPLLRWLADSLINLSAPTNVSGGSNHLLSTRHRGAAPFYRKMTGLKPGIESWLMMGLNELPSLKLTARTWKWMVGRLPSFWDDLFSGAMVGSGRIITIGLDMPKPCSSGKRLSHQGNPINLHYPKQLHCFGRTQIIGILKPLIKTQQVSWKARASI